MDAEKFFEDIAKSLGKRSLVTIKSTLRRSIRRAQVHKLIGMNIIELIDLPAGQPGRPSRAMTQEQAKVLKDGKRQGNRLHAGSEGQHGPLRRNPRGHRNRRANMRHQAVGTPTRAATPRSPS
ncbi:MAG: hypothetical protein ACRDOI_26445 [Trebonia sp.]